MRVSGTFFDGHVSKPHEVNISLGKGSLAFSLPDDPIIRRWYYKDLRNQDEYIKDRPLTLVNRLFPSQQLIIEDQNAAQTVLLSLPRSKRSDAKVSTRIPVLLGLSLALIPTIILSFWVLKHSSGFIARLIPYAWEKPIAEALVPELNEARAYAGKYPCRAETQKIYLQKILARLAKGSKLPEKVEFVVSPEKDVNAFALPGDIIMINQGLLNYVQSDQELAGVIAHELGHLTRKHVMENLVHMVGVQVVISAMAGGSDAMNRIGGAGAQIYALSHSRDHEREADQSAVDYMTAAGLSTNGLGDFLERIEKRDSLLTKVREYDISEYLLSHPTLKDRQDILSKGYAAKAKPSAVLTPADIKALRSAGTLACPATPLPKPKS